MTRQFSIVIMIALVSACGDPQKGSVDAGDVIPDDATDTDAAIDAALDTTPPDTTLVSTPSGISAPDVTFVIDSTEPGGTFRCSVDSTTLMSCSATQMFTALTAGMHTFRAAATDAAGNEDATPAEYTWMVDPTELDTMITSGPSAISGPDVELSFTATRAGTFECQLAPMETAFTACTSPKSYSDLAEVPDPGYTFHVRARDTANNLDETPATQGFDVDATSPVVTISAPANAVTVGTSVTVMFSSEPGATHVCQLDSETPITDCTSPHTFDNLTSAMLHTIQVTAADSFGNTGAPAMHVFTVDDQGPSVTVSGTPAAGTTVKSTSANLSFAIAPADEPTPFTFECRFNSTGAFAPCTGFVISGLVEGAQSLDVRARDRFDNVGPTVTHAWTIEPLFTTILNVRSGVAVGTRVEINNNSNNVRMTAKTSDRFWMQEAAGLATTNNRGITVMPTAGTGSILLVPGRTLYVTGTVSNLNGNLVLTQATVLTGSLLSAYQAKETSSTATNLLQEGNEGQLVNMAGRASVTAAVTCQSFDFCIVSCNQSTPVIHSIDATAGSVTVNRDHRFEGIVEGNGSGYTYFVTTASEESDSCL